MPRLACLLHRDRGLSESTLAKAFLRYASSHDPLCPLAGAVRYLYDSFTLPTASKAARMSATSVANSASVIGAVIFPFNAAEACVNLP